MRTIKFRVWDGKKMYYDNVVVYLGLEGDNPHTPLQFTGLLDKNGKEIYEGDILRQGARGRGRGVFKKVVEWRKVQRSIGFNVGESKQMEIIGNIYENSNLIEKTL